MPDRRNGKMWFVEQTVKMLVALANATARLVDVFHVH
jgi:hypothetical protein